MARAKFDSLGNRNSGYSAADIGTGIFQLAVIIGLPIGLWFIFSSKEEPAPSSKEEPAPKPIKAHASGATGEW